ncbi:MAG: hypothetical protein QXP42_02630 [Candidatus Micrarchaeia archaeon]
MPSLRFYAIAFSALLFFVFFILSLYYNYSLKTSLDKTTHELEAKSRALAEAETNMSRLNGKLAERDAQLSILKRDMESLSSEYNRTKEELSVCESELFAAKREINETKSRLTETKSEFQNLLAELLGIEESVNSSIQWFRDNSVFTPSMQSLRTSISSRCVQDSKLNLACIPYVLEKYRNFRYVSEEPDRLYPLEEMLNRGGDCEDFSLLLKAFLNTMKQSGANLKVEAWKEDPHSTYTIYETDVGYVYYDNAIPHSLGYLNSIYPIVICYTTVYAPPISEGHCIVALAEKEPSSVQQLYGLEGAETFEPQTGEYKGRIGWDFFICHEGDRECERTINGITFVITNSDLFTFTDGEWKSYSMYQDRLVALEERLRRALEGED